MRKYKQAIILAGGKGRRLYPYTTSLPKPLMPIGDEPILEVVVKQLRANGFRHIIMAVGHLAGLIQAYFKDGRKFGVKIEYSFEDKPLGTAGPIRLARNLDENFLVLNGDLVTDIDFREMFNYHVRRGNLCTIGIYKKRHKIDLGIIEFDRNNHVKDYIEKPNVYYPVSMGIYAFNRKIVAYIPKGKKSDFPELVRGMIKKNLPLNAYIHRGYWSDIGNHQDYKNVNQDFKRIRKRLLR